MPCTMTDSDNEVRVDEAENLTRGDLLSFLIEEDGLDYKKVNPA